MRWKQIKEKSKKGETGRGDVSKEGNDHFATCGTDQGDNIAVSRVDGLEGGPSV